MMEHVSKRPAVKDDIIYCMSKCHFKSVASKCYATSKI